MAWFIQRGDGAEGPYSAEDLLRGVQAGLMRPNDLIRRGDDDPWRRIVDVPELTPPTPSRPGGPSVATWGVLALAIVGIVVVAVAALASRTTPVAPTAAPTAAPAHATATEARRAPRTPPAPSLAPPDDPTPVAAPPPPADGDDDPGDWIDHGAPPEAAAAIEQGCTAQEMPTARLHERATLREAINLVLRDLLPEQGESLRPTDLQGWRAEWAPSANGRGPGICAATYRYRIAGQPRVASFFFIRGAQPVAYPGNEESSRIATLVDIAAEPRRTDARDASNAELMSRYALHRWTMQMREVLRRSELLDVYMDPRDDSALVIRPLLSCVEGTGEVFVRGALRNLQSHEIRRVLCHDALPTGQPSTSVNVPPGRHRRAPRANTTSV
ncbi:MAG: DUF4339 domain-containing protein [Polyangiales bacterium]